MRGGQQLGAGELAAVVHLKTREGRSMRGGQQLGAEELAGCRRRACWVQETLMQWYIHLRTRDGV